MDAVATNGLRYGGSVELRQNFGPTAGSTASSGGSADTFNSTLFVRRAFVYAAAEHAYLPLKACVHANSDRLRGAASY